MSDERIAPGDRRSRVHVTLPFDIERRSMVSDLLGQKHYHKREADDWPAHEHRRAGDPPIDPNRQKHLTEDDIMRLLEDTKP